MGGEGFGPHDEADSRACLEAAFERGIVHFDTANIYAHGLSEILLAKVFSHCRKQVFISSKGGLRWEGNRMVHDGSRVGLRESLFGSLARLGTDYLDLYFLHWPDPCTPISESIASLKAFQKEGLIRYWGISNFGLTDMKKVVFEDECIPHQVHASPIHLAMDLDQTFPVRVLEEGKKNYSCFNLATSPFEQGFMLDPDKRLSKNDLRRRNPYFNSDDAKGWMSSFSLDPPDLLRTLLLRSYIDAVVVGARSVSMLDSCFSD